MFRRNTDEQPLVQEFLHCRSRFFQGKRQDRRVALLFAPRVQHFLVGTDAGRDGHVRIRRVQFRQQLPQRRRSTGSDHQRPPPLVKRLHLLHHLPGFCQKSAGGFHGHPAGVVQRDPVFAADKQRHTERFFYIFHAAGDGRRGDMPLLRHPGQGAQVGKRHQLLQFVQVKHRIPHISISEKQISILIFYIFGRPL